jgi:hypothetical protein
LLLSLTAAALGCGLLASPARAADVAPFGMGVSNTLPPPGLASYTLFNATPSGSDTAADLNSWTDWTAVTPAADRVGIGSTTLSVAGSPGGTYTSGFIYNQDGSAVSAQITFVASPVSGELEVLADNGGQLGGTTVTVTSDGNTAATTIVPEGTANDWYLFSVSDFTGTNDTLTVTVSNNGGGIPELGGVGYSHCEPPCFPTPEPAPLAPLAVGALALFGFHAWRRPRRA